MIRFVCRHCGEGDKEIELTPVHLPIEGGTILVFFHNKQPPKNCLETWLKEQKALYCADGAAPEDITF